MLQQFFLLVYATSMYEFETRKYPKSWSLVKSHPFYPIAATVSEDGMLCAHDVELNITHSRQETSKILALTWHPRLKYLATGHQNSNISIWCIIDQDTCYRTIKTSCVGGISRLEWSRDGGTLSAGTLDGKLILLRVNKRGHMEFMAQYQTTSEIIFLHEASTTTEKTSQFLAADMNGGIYSLSETGCEKCVELKDGIELATFEEGNYHILTTKLAYFKLGFDCNTQKLVSKGDKIQLEKRNQKGLKVAWIAAFGLVYCHQGSLPRIWVKETDEIMLLQSTLDDVHFEFNPEMNILAVASAGGRVGFWEMVVRQNNMVSWTFSKSVEVESDVLSMDWLFTNLMIVRTNEGAQAIEIRRSVLAVGTKDLQAVKIRSRAIKLIRGELTHALECPGNVTSMQISGEYFVFRSGNVIRCYSVKHGPESIILQSKVNLDLHIGCYVMLSTNIVTASQSCLTVVNLSSLESEFYYNQPSDGDIIGVIGAKDKIIVVTLIFN